MALRDTSLKPVMVVGDSVDIVNAMPKLQAGFSGELRLNVNRTKPEHAFG
jgi:hypothetical protein